MRKEKPNPSNEDQSKPCENRQSRRSKGNRNKPKGKLNNQGRNNDPNWYFTSAELASQAAELSFQNYLGAGPVISDVRIPDIMVFMMNPSPGCTYQVVEGATSLPTDAQVTANANQTNLPATAITETKDGINLMSTKLYTLLSTYSGRTSSYGPQDIAIMHLAIGELTSVVENIRRAFGVAMSYNPRNRMLPLGLLKAMGFDGQDLISNLANYRMRFNVAIARINQIPILDNIGYIRKCRELYQRIYVDDVSSMAQIYLYSPNTTWVLHEEAIGSWTHGSWLKTESIANLVTMNDHLTLLESMINALLFSSTYNIVYADLVNLANKVSVPFTGFDYLAENYVVLPEYNRNANLQMHNLTIWQDAIQPGRGTGININVPYNLSSSTPANFYYSPYNNVYADARTNSVLYNPVFPVTYGSMNSGSSNTTWYSGLEIVDMDVDNPTLEDRIESMRFKVIESGYYVTQDETTRDRFYKIIPCLPDHYCVLAKLYDNDVDAPALIERNIRDKTLYPFAGGKLTQMKNAPIFYCKNNSNYCDNTVAQIYGDLTFFTTIDFNYLYRLNRLIATGLFDFRS